MTFTRRRFIETGAALLGASALPFAPARAKAKYTRYNATSDEGKAMLDAYAVAIEKMMALDPRDGRNWFRNAFVHTLDCPHDNWWFFVWHRGYLGWFEQTVREMSGYSEFAFPYWDWTQKACVPDQMFKGVLTPTNEAYAKYMSSFDTFKDYMNPALEEFWKGLSDDQQKALGIRMMPSLEILWKQVKGDPKNGGMFQVTPYARFLTAADPCLDADTAKAVDYQTVSAGLRAPTFDTFNSASSEQHSLQGDKAGILEGQPHNLTHNNVGGAYHVPNAQVGVMADNLSPIDPLFFLHHSNMDRLWDVWTRRQEALGRDTLPPKPEREKWASEKFMFYINSNNQPVTQIEAGSYVDMAQFGYDYQPGSGENLVHEQTTVALNRTFRGAMRGNAASVGVTGDAAMQADTHPIVAEVTVPYPASASAPRAFVVLVNAPAGNKDISPSSPYYAGSFSFFALMEGMKGNVTFRVPLNDVLRKLKGADPKHLNIQVVPRVAPGTGPTRTVHAPPPVKGIAVTVW
jgi:tyrosinase